MNDARSLAACLGVEEVILEERRTRLRAQLLQMWTDRAKRSCGCGWDERERESISEMHDPRSLGVYLGRAGSIHQDIHYLSDGNTNARVYNTGHIR